MFSKGLITFAGENSVVGKQMPSLTGQKDGCGLDMDTVLINVRLDFRYKPKLEGEGRQIKIYPRNLINTATGWLRCFSSLIRLCAYVLFCSKSNQFSQRTKGMTGQLYYMFQGWLWVRVSC